jgi:fatty acid synthase
VFAGSIEFVVMVQKGSGNFEVAEGGAAVVSGSVKLPQNISREVVSLEPPEPLHDDNLLELTSRDVYKELRLRGYNYQGLFRSLVSADNLGECQYSISLNFNFCGRSQGSSVSI